MTEVTVEVGHVVAVVEATAVVAQGAVTAEGKVAAATAEEELVMAAAGVPMGVEGARVGTILEQSVEMMV